MEMHLDINNDLVIHRQVKTNDIISRRFGDLFILTSGLPSPPYQLHH